MDLDALIAFAESEFARLEAYRTQLAAAERLLAVFRARAPQDPLTVEAQRTVDSLRGIAQGIETELTGLLERLREEFAPERLPPIKHMGTVDPSMNATAATVGTNVSKAKVKNPGLFQRHLHERNLSLRAWVEQWNAGKRRPHLSYDTAKSWVKPVDSARSIPHVWAELIAKEFGDPELLESSNWPKGIQD